jgi:hypothetical protein
MLNFMIFIEIFVFQSTKIEKIFYLKNKENYDNFFLINFLIKNFKEIKREIDKLIF